MNDKSFLGDILGGASDLVSGGIGAIGDLFNNIFSSGIPGLQDGDPLVNGAIAGSPSGFSWGNLFQSAIGPAITGAAAVYGANTVADQNEYNRDFQERQFAEQLRQRDLDRQFSERQLMQQLALAKANQELQAAIAKQRLLAEAYQSGQGAALRGREDESAALNALVQNIQRNLLRG